ncbi:DUF4148 domain-containing protein [Allopusillimonas ginsengisoli]|uniref:DUF4148 domain-containing protein n=1 Tax=Allopusillimonas ginsengisoli TaxID=453575 RepID=UPI00102144D5|nr:DUF4148 domain-containing protein [Allopusillimonas ginsengisoli]TEA79771.1 DUF4148 domain-containing protein [Allopusillimonas ginsengisoli]
MSVRFKMLIATFALAATAPVTSFAYWVPDNTEQGGTEVYDWSNMKSRTQVLQELEEAKADPTWESRQGEATGSWPQDQAASTKTRAQVRQELASMTDEEKAYIESFYTGA